jgi:hypothetical protein
VKSALHVSDDLSLPAQAVTETFGILAARGSGKSNTAAVMAEEMFEVGLPFVVVDPVRAWWGMRSSRDGKKPGLPIPIFGGRHGDVPLERSGGNLIADLVVDQRLSCILDVSEFDSEAAKKAFLLDFSRRLYTRNEHPLHLFLEEADDYIPQRPMRDEPQLLRAWENIVRRGRNRGLGCTLITQRSAALNKNVLTQVQTLIPMRTTGPQDIAAIEAWVKYHNQSHEILASLPSLEDGEGWVWSPHFLKKTVRVKFRLRHTFDSGATPKASASPRPPATLAEIDLESVKKRMEDTIERAKAEDPKELRKRIVELEKKLASVLGELRMQPSKIEKVEVPVLNMTDRKALDRAAKGLETLAEKLRSGAWMVTTIENAARDLRAASFGPPKECHKNANPTGRTNLDVAVEGTVAAMHGRLRPFAERLKTELEKPKLGKAELSILAALSQYPEGRTKRQVALLAGYAVKGGAFANALGRLRSLFMIEGFGPIKITTKGANVGGVSPLPQGRDLLEHWMRQLGAAEREIMRVLTERYPKAMTKEEIAAETVSPQTRAPYEPKGGAFGNALGRLRTLELIQGYGEITASEELF